MVRRAEAALSSNRSTICAVEVSAGTGGSDDPKPSSSMVSVGSTQEGSVATCVASSPRDHDFSCGFQASPASGTRSRRRRVIAISWSNSGISVSAIGMRLSLRVWCRGGW